jgi:uncharacterized membrane protein YkoI
VSKFSVTSLCFVLLFGVVQSALAQDIPIRPTQIDLNRSAGAREIRNDPQLKVTERQAVALARQRFSGNILRISLVGEGGKQRYQIRMEKEGKVFTVYVNVVTGRISGGG